jgi:hypothetical protein
MPEGDGGAMKIERWFQQPLSHPDTAVTAAWEEPGDGPTQCLGYVVANGITSWESLPAIHHLAAIIDRLFPSRICNCRWAAGRVIHFNNHRETTREDVDKVLRIYTEETEA